MKQKIISIGLVIVIILLLSISVTPTIATENIKKSSNSISDTSVIFVDDESLMEDSYQFTVTTN